MTRWVYALTGPYEPALIAGLPGDDVPAIHAAYYRIRRVPPDVWVGSVEVVS